MGTAGYICVQLYCIGFKICSLSFTTCLGLNGHLQVCRIFYFHIPEGFCFAAFLVRCLTYVVTLVMFSIYVLFLCCFPSLFLLFPCVCVYLCCCLSVYYHRLFFVLNTTYIAICFGRTIIFKQKYIC
jgi:hypothetical protein